MIFGHMGIGREYEGIKAFGDLGEQMGKELAGEWIRYKESRAKEEQIRRLLMDLLVRDQEFLMMAFEAGQPISWLKGHEYRFMRFEGELRARDGEAERLILLVCKGRPKSESGYVGGLFGEKIVESGVDMVGVTLNGSVPGYLQIGRFKSFRGVNGDVLWRYLMSSDDQGSEMKTELVRSYGDQVELIHQRLIGR